MTLAQYIQDAKWILVGDLALAVAFYGIGYLIGFRRGQTHMAKYTTRAMRIFAIKAGVPEHRRRQLFMLVQKEMAGKR